MANEQNLTPFTSDQSHDEAVKNGRLGGITSGQARRERRKLREDLENLLGQTAPENGRQLQECICIALIKNALKGNPRAFEIIRDTIGEKPADNVNIRPEIDYTALNDAFERICKEP